MRWLRMNLKFVLNIRLRVFQRKVACGTDSTILLLEGSRRKFGDETSDLGGHASGRIPGPIQGIPFG